MNEKGMFRVIGTINVKDGSGYDSVVYQNGQEVEFDLEVGNNYVEQGLAERIDGGEEVETTEDAPVEDAPVEDAPVEDAPVEDAPVEDAPVEDAPAPTQSDEDATLGVDTAKQDESAPAENI
jgi:hypothetical protein